MAYKNIFISSHFHNQLKLLKKRKARDTKGLVAEMLQHGGDKVVDMLVLLYNGLLKEDALPPESWKTSVVKVIFKKGDAKLPENYRPISILSILYKLFSRVLDSRVQDFWQRRSP